MSSGVRSVHEVLESCRLHWVFKGPYFYQMLEGPYCHYRFECPSFRQVLDGPQHHWDWRSLPSSPDPRRAVQSCSNSRMNLKTVQRSNVHSTKPVCHSWCSLTSARPRKRKIMISLADLNRTKRRFSLKSYYVNILWLKHLPHWYTNCNKD